MAASDTRRFQFPVTARYFRVVYTNGGTIQGAFRVQTILHANNVLTSIHRLVSNTDPDRSAQLVKSAIIAQAAGSGDFVAVNATAGGNLKVGVEEFASELTITGSMSVVLSAGTANIGKVEVTNSHSVVISGQLPSGSNNIGIVDLTGSTSVVLSAALPAGAAKIGKVSVTGSCSVVLSAGTANIGSVSVTGSHSVVLSAALPAGNALIGKVSVTGSCSVVLAAGTANIGTVNNVSATISAIITSALPTGANKIGKVSITGSASVVLAAGTANIGTVNDISATVAVAVTNIAAQNTGGAQVYYTQDLDESEEQITSGAATFYGGVVMNLTASVLYFHLYNATSATVNVGTTTPLFSMPIATQGDTNGAGVSIPVPPCGIACGTALTIAATTDAAGSAAPAANACHAVIWYE
jgi:hypothetical protein